jgi:hypothetical protein
MCRGPRRPPGRPARTLPPAVCAARGARARPCTGLIGRGWPREVAGLTGNASRGPGAIRPRARPTDPTNGSPIALAELTRSRRRVRGPIAARPPLEPSPTAQPVERAPNRSRPTGGAAKEMPRNTARSSVQRPVTRAARRVHNRGHDPDDRSGHRPGPRGQVALARMCEIARTRDWKTARARGYCAAWEDGGAPALCPERRRVHRSARQQPPPPG